MRHLLPQQNLLPPQQNLLPPHQHPLLRLNRQMRQSLHLHKPRPLRLLLPNAPSVIWAPSSPARHYSPQSKT